MQRYSYDLCHYPLLYFQPPARLFNNTALRHSPLPPSLQSPSKSSQTHNDKQAVGSIHPSTMSATKCCIVFMYVLFMFSSSWGVAMGGRYIPSSVPSTMRPASVDYVKINPQLLLKHKHKVNQVKACMPKGLRHSSAPSRYVNYQTLGSSCATKPH
ncbi:hypothetical protein V6N13_010973 [Hibiscus sabdariffa]|uniref:Transmembrane protein n=1 Tax=Hibiscus sabdariffa TaxID=183260 RepID=A0ABR2SAU9_9ROSI